MIRPELKTFCWVLATALWLAAVPAYAACPWDKDTDDKKTEPKTDQKPNGNGYDCGVITFVTENDLYVFDRGDRHYTSGIRAGWLSSSPKLPASVDKLSSFLQPWDFNPPSDKPFRRRYGIAVGHNLYTPENKTTTDLIRNDRPYAAWLYVGAALQWETDTRLDTLELDIGVIGPAALGEPVQNNWHRLIGAKRAHGWDNQIKNEPGIALVYERKGRWILESSEQKFGIDAIPHVSGSVGNVFTYVGTGVMLRFGEDLRSDFGPPRIRPALPGSASFEPPDRFGWYVFVGAEGRAVLRDVTLDGNTFTDSHSVSRKTFVGDFQAGVALLLARQWRVSYTQVLRTREFEGQNRPDLFGSLSASLRF